MAPRPFRRDRAGQIIGIERGFHRAGTKTGCALSEENKDLVRRLVQGSQHEHRSEVAGELIADDFVDRDGAMSQPGASAPS
jgi:hypothetical protein